MLEFVVGENGNIWPYRAFEQYLEFEAPAEANKQDLPAAEVQTQELYTKQDIPSDKKVLPSTLEQILRGNLDVFIREGGAIELVRNQDKAYSQSNTPPTISFSSKSTLPSQPARYTEISQNPSTVDTEGYTSQVQITEQAVAIASNNRIEPPIKVENSYQIIHNQTEAGHSLSALNSSDSNTLCDVSISGVISLGEITTSSDDPNYSENTKTQILMTETLAENSKVHCKETEVIQEVTMFSLFSCA